MLNESEIREYCKSNRLSAAAIDYIDGVRSSPPARRVGDDARGNVCSRIPSQLIGQTVQAESRTCEAVFVFESDLLGRNHELWDQPTPIQIRRDKGARGTHVSSYTPDYLRLSKSSGPALVECKTRSQVDRLISDKPNEWTLVEGQPQFLPAKKAAEEIGLALEVYVTDDWAPTYLANLELLYALCLQGPLTTWDRKLERAQGKLSEEPLTIFGLCETTRDLEPAIIYRWLANRQVFGALKAQLLSQEDVFRLFASAEAAAEFEAETLRVLRLSPEIHDENLAAIIKATPRELAHAIKLRDKFDQVCRGERKPTRNEYRYMGRFGDISSTNGHTLAAFLPKFSERGNDRSRLTPQQDSIIADKVKSCVKTGSPKSNSALTGQVNNECSKQGVPKVSAESVRLRVINAKPEDIAQGRLGTRGYHSALRPISATSATLRSEIPGLIAHIDSTQFDVRAWAESPLSKYFECPWIYVIYDEACSRAQGCWIGFGKSDRFALSLAVRDALRRQGSLPPFLFSDRGAEYGSIWYEQVLALENITKYARPAGAPRFGGIQESCLKQINTQLAHNMAGNTWADQRGRAASGSKKSRATARLAFELIVHTVHDFLFTGWNDHRHGIADANPNELWRQGRAQFGDVGRLGKHDDLGFLIATSIPVRASIGDRKGIRVAYREYWNDELNSIRKPFGLDEARLDPGTPSILYVKVKNDWFVTHARDHSAVRILTPEGRFLENYRVRRNAAVTRADGRSSKERLARRMEELEISNAAISQAATPQDNEEPPTSALPRPATIDLSKYDDIPFVRSTF